MDGNNILHIIMLDGVRLDLEDAVDNALVIKNLSKGTRVLKLIDARVNFSLDKKAREFVQSVDLKQTIARAVVKGSKISMLLLKFFTGISKPKIPTQIFSDYDEVYKWLLSFKE